MYSLELLTIMILSLLLLCAGAQAGSDAVTLHPKCRPLPFATNWWVTQNQSGELLMLDSVGISRSTDGGKTWSATAPVQVPEGTRLFRGAAGSLLLFTRQGELILFYMDSGTHKSAWSKERNAPGEGIRLDAWVCRSQDGGKTWTHAQKLVDGYCGALIDAKQLSTGEVVAVMQDLLMDQARHYVYAVVSSDGGQTWKRGNSIDLGGRGDHDGAMEPTIVELSDGRVLMLIRTNLDRFWAAHSDTRGLYWRSIGPSSIAASSAPGFLLRLASGRIALVWNRTCAEGQNRVERSLPSGVTTEVMPSWFRKELSISFSENDGVTWSKPVVLASESNGEICYPYMWERAPGEIWVVARLANGQKPAFSLLESDFFVPASP